MPIGMEELSQDTVALLRKAASSGILSSTGAVGVDLSGFTSLVPVNVPARMNTQAFPREIAGEGSTVAQWRTWLNINNQQSSAAVGRDYPGSMTKFQEQDVFAPYLPVAKAGLVTLDAVAYARNYVDNLAQAELQTLNQLFIAQDMLIPNAQAWSLGTPAAPTLTASSTGGSITGGSAVHVKVAVRSGANYYEGGSTIASSDATVTTSTSTDTGSVTASATPLKCGVAYDWYVGSTSSNQVYYSTTTVASVTITSIPSSANAVSNLQLISSLAPGNGISPLADPPVAGNGTPPTADTSYSANYYNGIMASTLGDYGTSSVVAPGSGTSTGATYINFKGAAPSGSSGNVDVLDQINDSVWGAVLLSPTAFMVNSAQADEISAIIMGSSAATTFLPPTDADARTNLSGGGYVGRYINRAAGGVTQAIEVHPHVPPGTIIARTDRVPFPGSNIGTAFAVRCQFDSMRFDYASNREAGTLGGGPRYEFEIRSNETLVNFAPGAQAVVTNVG